nr:hypothetical protein [Tanacetum cinerariifolium]
LRSLETTFSEYRQTNWFVDAMSAIPGIVHQYMTQQMTEAVREAVQIQTDRLQDSLQGENDEFLRNIDENRKKIIKGQVKNQALVEAYDAEKAILDTYGESTILKRRREDDDQEGPSVGSDRGLNDKKKEVSMHQLALHLKQQPGVLADLPQGLNLDNCLPPRRPPSPDRDWNKTLPAAQGDAQSWISDLARQTDARSSFNELLDTLIDFSNFIMNRLGVATLTPKCLAGPTYELIRGSCTTKAADYGHIKWIEDLVPRV